MSRNIALIFLFVAAISAAGCVLVLRSDEPRPSPATTRAAAESASAPWQRTADSLTSCSDTDLECLAQAWSNEVSDRSAATVLAQLDRAGARDQRVAGMCHPITHRIGAAGFTRHDGNVGAALADGSATCQGGYYHGVMQELVRVDKRPLDQVVADACSLGGDVSGSVRNDCLHGLGHGLTMHLGWELPDALSACRALGEADRAGCTGGVFMETFTPSVPGLETRWNRSNDPNEPCRHVERRDRGECHYAAGMNHVRINGPDPAKFAQRCERVDAPWRERCAEALGANRATGTGRDPDRTAAACALLTEHQDSCVLGAARAIASWRGRPGDAAAFCHRVDVTDQPSCWEGVGNIARMVSTSERAARGICVTATRGATKVALARDACVNGRTRVAVVGSNHAAD